MDIQPMQSEQGQNLKTFQTMQLTHTNDAHHFSKVVLAGMGALLVIVIALGAGFYLSVNNGEPEQGPTTFSIVAPTVIVEPTVKVEPTLSETHNKTHWKTLQYTQAYSFTTTDWSDFRGDVGEEAITVRYPTGWTVEETVFYDAKKKKIAEFSPGVVTLAPEQHCYDAPYTGTRSELVSEKKIMLSGMPGFSRVYKTDYEGATKTGITKYPHAYCLENNGKAFIIAFYVDNGIASSTDQKLFEGIISTVSF